MRRLMIAIMFGAVASATTANAQDFGASLKMQEIEFRVTVGAEGAPAECQIAGYLYYHGSYRERPLQVVVHGATYNHSYWDFPTINGRDYSYARYMIEPARHYAVLAIDQLGAGKSCKPTNGVTVTLDETASALNQVLQQLRSGDNPTGYAFRQIVLVGHSAGSFNAIYVQAKWHPADALVVTGARHLEVVSPAIAALLPVANRLARQSYFTLTGAARAAFCYNPLESDPAVVAYDNATADMWTGGQMRTTFWAFVYPVLVPAPLDGVDLVTGPVLVQLGDMDAFFPAASADTEASFWRATVPEIQTLPNMGHSFNLHFGRRASWKGIDGWLKQTLAK